MRCVETVGPALTDAADACLLGAHPLHHAARLHLAHAVLLGAAGGRGGGVSREHRAAACTRPPAAPADSRPVAPVAPSTP